MLICGNAPLWSERMYVGQAGQGRKFMITWLEIRTLSPRPTEEGWWGSVGAIPMEMAG